VSDMTTTYTFNRDDVLKLEASLRILHTELAETIDQDWLDWSIALRRDLTEVLRWIK
jgi:hypothetical protein